MATTGVSRATENIVESRAGFRSQECSVAAIEVEYVDNPIMYGIMIYYKCTHWKIVVLYS